MTYHELQKEVEHQRANLERARGYRAQILNQLERDFGLKTLTAAKKHLQELELKADFATQEQDRLLTKFITAYGHQLGIDRETDNG